MMPKQAGVLIEYNAAKRFVPAAVAQRVVRRSVISEVPGAPVGMILFEGRVIPVVGLGMDGEQLLVCDVQGELVAFAGVRVIDSGWFEPAASGVRWGSELIASLDLSTELARIERAARSRRAKEEA